MACCCRWSPTVAIAFIMIAEILKMGCIAMAAVGIYIEANLSMEEVYTNLSGLAMAILGIIGAVVFTIVEKCILCPIPERHRKYTEGIYY